MIKVSYTIYTLLSNYFYHTKARNAGRTKHSSKPLTAKNHVPQRLPWFFASCFHGTGMHFLPFVWENSYYQIS